MSCIDSKCYELISGAGLEPILVGGRGQASGFIMRMMAENKKKHKGQYRNPSAPNDYGSKMKKWVAFDIDKLANKDQNGRNKSDYGASPFIIKHFGSVAESKKQDSPKLEINEILPETQEQKAARMQKQAEDLEEKARALLEASRKQEKVKGFLKSALGIRRAKKLLGEKKAIKKAEDAKAKAEAEKAQKAEEKRKRDEDERKRNPPKPYVYPKGHPTDYLGEPISYADLARAEERRKDAKREAKERKKKGILSDTELALAKMAKIMGRR